MTPPIIRKTRLKEYKPLVERNLARQQEFLETEVKAALAGRKKIFTASLVRELNRRAMEHLWETAGEYRRGAVEISNSGHKPPPAAKVPALVRQSMDYITRNWDSKSPMHLAAYALWSLGWIHPFMEGNGRTARAVCQAIICVKHGAWLPEKNLMPKKDVRGARALYYAALREADESFAKAVGVDLSALEGYLNTLVFKGVSKALVSKAKR